MLDGVKFDGKTLRVSKEKRSAGKNNRFGSSKWAGGGFDGKPSHLPQVQKDEHTETEVVDRVRRVVSKEISDSQDPVTSAIACTAAVSLLSSVDVFGLDEAAKNTQSNRETALEGNMSNEYFKTRCQLPMSESLSEYGEQDLDWKTRKPGDVDESNTSAGDITNTDFVSRCKMPLSELMAEYGEQDINWKKQQQPTASENHQIKSSSSNSTKQNTKNKPDNGMLAPFDKAFIHIELLSFGYKYGAPSHSKNGFTYAHPLPPLDCRELERAPAHVAKFNGLSYLVKKALLNPEQNENDATESDAKDQPKTESPMKKKANELADDIIKVLVESIDEGGHGPISPLTMTISVGSEYGRHRSVVLVEHLAVVLRARLRRNDGKGYGNGTLNVAQNGIVKQLVSVETRHRDVEAKHKDEEAFGEDLKKEVRAAEKAKRRQEREKEYW